MLVKTRGLVLGLIKYKETSVIVNIYTEQLGLKAYLVNGVRDKKGKSAFFQPLTILDLVVYDQAGKNLNRIAEYNIHRAYHTCIYEPKKITVMLFLSELLIKTLKEEHPDEMLFSFLIQWLLLFDQASGAYEDFHLFFLLEYASLLGIKPTSAEDIAREVIRPVDDDVKILLDQMLNEEQPMENLSINISSTLRRKALELLMDYFYVHFPSMGKIQSLAILREVFS